MEFINKFRANAKRATMVQSRIKTVEKMDAEAPEAVTVDPVWRFSIPNAVPLGPPIIAVNDVSFDYHPVLPDGSKKPESEFLLQKVNFGVTLTSKIAILGANGEGNAFVACPNPFQFLPASSLTSFFPLRSLGKTTLLNLIMGKLRAEYGDVSIHSSLRIGHFTQHSSDNFDLTLSALENLLIMFEEAEDPEMRAHLGKFQIQGNDALKPMMLLSGGQKSRVAFSALAYKKPHVLVIDEGSNHLSMEAVDALVEAVQDFKGGVLVVSHDSHFVSNCCSEIWVVADGQATKHRGDFNSYKTHTANLTQKRIEDSVKRINASAN
jgi:ATP-binding cassette subfamily F protein 3